MTPTSPAFQDSHFRRAMASRRCCSPRAERRRSSRHSRHRLRGRPFRRCRRPWWGRRRDRVDDLLLGRLATLEDGDVLAETEDRDPVGHLEDVVRLCEMRTTASPCSARRRTRSSTWRVCATPSAAVGSSRITMREFHITGAADRDRLALAAGDRLATGCRIELIVVTERPFSTSAVRASITGSRSRKMKSRTSRPRYMFWTTSRLSQRARSWYTTSIPSFAANPSARRSRPSLPRSRRRPRRSSRSRRCT